MTEYFKAQPVLGFWTESLGSCKEQAKKAGLHCIMAPFWNLETRAFYGATNCMNEWIGSWV